MGENDADVILRGSLREHLRVTAEICGGRISVDGASREKRLIVYWMPAFAGMSGVGGTEPRVYR